MNTSGFEMQILELNDRLAESKRLEAELQTSTNRLALVLSEKEKALNTTQIEAMNLRIRVKTLEEKFAEFGGAQEAYDELMIIWRLFDDEFGQPNEGEDSLSQLVSQVIQHRDILDSKSSDCAGRVKTLEDALKSVVALDFTRNDNGERNLYSGAPKFVKAWLLCEKVLAAKEPKA